ncbi:MAG: hypothetical protein P4L51_23900 [Puia sp.]|nr:hypothetical protein [Puia sp.]
MRKIVSIVVSEVVVAELERVFKTLMDHGSYPDWWHVPAKILPGDVVVFHPLWFVTIKIRIEKRPERNQIYFHYIEGPIVGLGVWKLAWGEDERSTEVSYSVDIRARNYLFQKVLESSLFRKRHERDIRRLIESVECLSR